MKKDLYEAPTVQVIEMEVQGVIAMSPGPDPEEVPWSPS